MGDEARPNQGGGDLEYYSKPHARPPHACFQEKFLQEVLEMSHISDLITTINMGIYIHIDTWEGVGGCGRGSQESPKTT